jgi:hypothetical protein
MNKVKVRCSVCGKSFKTPSLKKTVCPSCEADMKRAKHQPAAQARPQPAPATAGVDVRAALRAAQENQGQFGAYRPPAPPPASEKPAPPATGAPAGLAARADVHPQTPGRAGQHAVKGPRPAKPQKPRQQAPRPPRERKPRVQMKPFEPAPEQVAAVRQRYLDLAHPEFDGIRHQIANEMGIPLRVVKEIVKGVRAEQEIPSWWDTNGNLPDAEHMEQIKALYLPLLPDPEVGVHKRIAAELKLSNTSVYQAIGAIRAEMELPRYAARADQNGHDDTQDAGTPPREDSLLEMATGE